MGVFFSPPPNVVEIDHFVGTPPAEFKIKVFWRRVAAMTALSPGGGSGKLVEAFARDC